MLAHNVYFTLNDKSEAGQAALVAACREHLTGHPGVLFFACGTREAGLSRPVNDQGFDVALHLVFESKAAHDVYQDSDRHVAFVEGNKHCWERARVFDSDVTGE